MKNCRALIIALNNFDKLLFANSNPAKAYFCRHFNKSRSTNFRYIYPNDKNCKRYFLIPKPSSLSTPRPSSTVSLPPSAYDQTRSAYVPGKSKIEDTILVRNENGLCLLVLQLYSRNEVCRFVIKPLMHTLNDFIMHVKVEDPGIEKIKVYTTDGQLICNSTSCSNLLRDNFILQLNGLNYLVDLDNLDFSSPYLNDDSQKNLVAQLYMALNSAEIYLKRQEKLLQRQEELQFELEPFEKNLSDMKNLAQRKTGMLGWVGLSMMGMQFGILARLTWWEYSWDIMEPVTYFITYATIMAVYGYFVVTNKEYLYPTTYERQMLAQVHKIAGRGAFDLVRYNKLRDEAERIKYELRRLQDPLRLQLHPYHLDRGLTPLALY